jgi:galactokinase
MNQQERKSLIDKKFKDIYKTSPIHWVQAPGRVDLMGSHTDYNLGFVLTQAINQNTWICIAPRTDRVVHIASLNTDGISEFTLDNIQYDNDHGWSNYIRGVADVFQKEGYVLSGFDGLVHSTIPFGSGLSSSAALEVAAATAFETLGGWEIDPIQKVQFALEAENDFVGLNCGIMDQYSSVMGVANNTILLDCRSITHEIKPIALGIQVMICDTKAERALTGSEYPERRAQCEEGVRILSRYYSEIQSLRDASMEKIITHKSDMEPVIYNRCRFIIEENQRVLDMAYALEEGRFIWVGELANSSYEGARDQFEIVSSEMSVMHDVILSAPGAYGARGAGAGFGGCLVAFVDTSQIEPFTRHVMGEYKRKSGIDSEVFPVKAVGGAGVLFSD